MGLTYGGEPNPSPGGGVVPAGSLSPLYVSGHVRRDKGLASLLVGLLYWLYLIQNE